MEEEKKLPFSDALDALFMTNPPPLALLQRLSDLTIAEFVEFSGRWSDVDTDQRHVIVRHLANISEDDFVVDFSTVLEHALSDPHPPVRQAALDGVWDATDVRLVKPIIRLLQTDENDEVRVAAASALAHFVLLAEWGQVPARISPPIVDALLEVHENEGAAVSIKRAALEALGAAPHPRVTKLIQVAYEAPQLEMQMSAIFAMGNSADDRWLPTVLDEMDSPFAEMRAEAARAAGSIGGSAAVEALANTIVDEETAVAMMAVTALGQIGGDMARSTLENVLNTQDLTELHDAAKEALEELMLLGGAIDFDWLDGDADSLE